MKRGEEMQILKDISDAVVNMDEENIEELVKRAVESEVPLEDIYSKGLNNGMIKALENYENKEFDIPEVIVCADILNKGIKTIESFGNLNSGEKEKVLISVVEGDTHEIGKNIVKIMLEAAGFDVIDLGVNKSSKEIIEVALREKVKIIGLSSMMTTTREEMRKLVSELDKVDIEDKPKVIIGGGSVTDNYSKEIKADGYSKNAPEAVKLINKILKEMA